MCRKQLALYNKIVRLLYKILKVYNNPIIIPYIDPIERELEISRIYTQIQFYKKKIEPYID